MLNMLNAKSFTKILAVLAVVVVAGISFVGIRLAVLGAKHADAVTRQETIIETVDSLDAGILEKSAAIESRHQQSLDDFNATKSAWTAKSSSIESQQQSIIQEIESAKSAPSTQNAIFLDYQEPVNS